MPVGAGSLGIEVWLNTYSIISNIIPKYYQRFRYTWNTDELIFHTILFDQAETAKY